jgi:hypothetical protein
VHVLDLDGVDQYNISVGPKVAKTAPWEAKDKFNFDESPSEAGQGLQTGRVLNEQRILLTHRK